MLSEPSGAGTPPAKPLGASADASEEPKTSDPTGDFTENWLTSRVADGKHDPAMVRLLVEHRKKDSIAEPALLKALGQYAQALRLEQPIQPVVEPTAAKDSE